MRLIDADKLVENLELMAKYQPEHKQSTILGVCATIKAAPTIDAEPVRHGRWIPRRVGADQTQFQCSECPRTIVVVNDYFAKPTKWANKKYPYCHCGAKMDGENKC